MIYTDVKEITRPVPDHDYDAMPGMKKTFLFQAVRGTGVILQRKFPCWCLSCASMPSPGEFPQAMDSSYCCIKCETRRDAQEDGDDLPWIETSVARTDPSGQKVKTKLPDPPEPVRPLVSLRPPITVASLISISGARHLSDAARPVASKV